MKMSKIEGLDFHSVDDYEVSIAEERFPAPKSKGLASYKGGKSVLMLGSIKTGIFKLGGRCFLSFVKSTPMRLQPYSELIPQGRKKCRWKSLGNDPYFILFPTFPSLMRQGGWFHLEYFFECSESVLQHVYIDYGIGYQPDVAVSHQADGRGRMVIPLYLPKTTKSLRLDPMAAPAEFTIKDVKLVKQDVLISDNRANRYLQNIDRLSFYLTSLGQAVRSEGHDYEWVSSGSDPCFHAMPKHVDPVMSGWYLLTLKLENGWGEGDAKLYFDTGDGFNELDTVIMPFENSISMQRVVRFVRDVSDFRFDPQETEGEFSIHELMLARVDEAVAITAMVERIADYRDDIDGLSPQEAEEVIKQGLKISSTERWHDALLRSYGETFVPKSDAKNGKLAYRKWIEHIENYAWPDDIKVENLVQCSQAPVISVLLPVYNTPENLLRLCIESVQEQRYPRWELCIADDASTLPHVARVLAEYESRDDRIKVVSRAYNGHISRASNNALLIATGDYVALLDHDDLLSPHALSTMAAAIQENPEAMVLYSDEDKVDEAGNRFDPHFKCSWNFDLFLSQNYVSHLGVYKMEVLDLVGGFREGVEGSQDQDLLLRCLRHVKPGGIVHVPRILYHWRATAGSTALATDGKSYTTAAGIKSLQEYVRESGIEGASIVQGLAPNTYRVRWPIPEAEPLVSLLIPTRDKKAITELAVRSILEKTIYTNYEIIILDNGSVEAETLEFFRSIQQEDDRVKVVGYDLPFNYSAINNFGARQAKGDIFGLINNDVEVISGEWLTEMVSQAIRGDVGCVGAKLYYSNDTLQHGGVITGIGGVAGHSHKHFPRASSGYFNRLQLVQSLSAVTGACLLVRREIYESLGGLNETNLKIAFNDVDFCLRVRDAGYRNIWTPYAELYHHESVSRGHEDTPEKVERFASEVAYMKTRWGDILINDPYYSSHLTKVREDFSIGGVDV